MTVPLTIVVPVFNEERTIDVLLGRLTEGPYPDQQVIVVDDGSTDRTPELLRAWESRAGWLVLRQPVNRGKGAAVRFGLQHAIGDVTVIQDADLEYDPAELPALVEPIRRGEARVVYGSRYLHGSVVRPWYSPYRLAVGGLNRLSRVLYGQRLTDHATCYKAMPTALWRELDLQAERFELCAEVTAKLGRRGVPILEVPISYRPRTRSGGQEDRLARRDRRRHGR